MKLISLFGLLFFTFLTARPVKVKPVHEVPFSNDEFVSVELLKSLKEVKERTLALFNILKLDDPIYAAYQSQVPHLMSEYLCVTAFCKLGDLGELNPYMIYRTIEKMLNFCLASAAPNPNEFDKNFAKRLKERVRSHQRELKTGKLPEVIQFWAGELVEVQKKAITQIHRPSHHYESMVKLFYVTGGTLDVFWKSVAAPKGSEFKFDLWIQKVVYVETHYLVTLWLMIGSGIMPEQANADFVKFLMTIPDAKFKNTIKMGMYTKLRENFFMCYFENMEVHPNYKEYLKQTKTPLLVADLESRTSATIADRVVFTIGLIVNTSASMRDYWNAQTTFKNRRHVTGLSNGIMFVTTILEDLQNLNCVLPLFPEQTGLLFKGKFTPPEALEFGFSKNLYGIFDALEETLAKAPNYPHEWPIQAPLLHALFPLMRTLYRFIEFSRSIMFLTDHLLKLCCVRSNPTSGDSRRYYAGCSEYLEHVLEDDQIGIMDLDFKELNDKLHENLDTLGRLTVGYKPIFQMPEHFYKFLEKKATEIPTSSYWTSTHRNAQKLVFMKVEKPEIKVEAPKIKAAVTKLSPSKLKRKQKRQMNTLPKPVVLNDDSPIIQHGEQFALVRVEPLKSSDLLSEIIAEKEPIDKKEKVKKERKEKFSFGRTKTSLQHRLESAHIVLNPLPWLKDSKTMIAIPGNSRTSYQLTYREQEPTHHAIAAKAIGYVPASQFDPRDYLMVHLIIGERVWVKVVKPLLDALRPYEKELHLKKTFKTSMTDFKSQLDILQVYDPDTFENIMRQANIQDTTQLNKCLDYYQKRNTIAHPSIPEAKKLRDFVANRHISSLELNRVLEVLPLERMRKSLECHESIPIKKIHTSGRPTNLISPEETDSAIAVLWINKVYEDDKIKFTRRIYAHMKVSDSVYQSYIDYIFKDHQDHEFLSSL